MADPIDTLRLCADAFETGPVAQLLFDAGGTLAAANANGRTLLHISSSDVGRSVEELDVSSRIPGLAGLVAAGAARTMDDVQWPDGQVVRVLRIVCTPLPGAAAQAPGIRIDVLDTTEEAALRLDLRQTSRELAAAYQHPDATTEQLRASNEHLLVAVEQLEATTEELRRVRAAATLPTSLRTSSARDLPGRPSSDGV